MSECIPTAPNNKGAIQYTHLFLCISSGRRLTNFSMRSLFFQIHLHPSLCPLISHSVWCHRPDVHFNAAFYVELSKLEPLTINDLSISFDLYSRQLQSSSHLGTAKLALNQKETLQKGKRPITYFYHQDPVDLIDPYTPTPVGNIFVTIALGYEEQINLIEPQTRFIQVLITPIDKKNTRYSSPSNWMKTAHKHGWMSIEEIEENWMQIAQSNGWIPFQKSDNLTLETFNQVDILKEYKVQPTADLLTIQPDSDSNSLFQEPPIVTHEFIPPEEIAQIFPQPKTKFNNKIKKPITVMDFFPRLSYSNKYDNSEKSDSEWDILIGKYLKSSSSTLKSFPKQKRTKSAVFDRPPFLNDSVNQLRNMKSNNIERSSSQYLNMQKVNNSNSISQSESSELDSSNNNFIAMLNNDENLNNNKSNQNKLRKSKNYKQNKKYDLDDDEKEWSSDFFSDSLDTASNIELESDLNNQKNKKDTNISIINSLEEIVEKEMEKLSKNSKQPLRKNNYQSAINKIDSVMKEENEIDDSNKSKTVLFSPPPSLTQVIQNADKNNEKCDQQNEIDNLNSQIENLNNPEEEINDKYNDANIENNAEDYGNDKNFQQSQNYSNLDDHQIQKQQQTKKFCKRKRHTNDIQQTTDFNQENYQLQVVQNNELENFVNNSKNENRSDFPEKTTIKRRKLRSPSPAREQKEIKNRDQDAKNQNEEEPFSSYNYNQNQANYEKSPDQFEDEDIISAETFRNENNKSKGSNQDDFERNPSPTSQSIQINKREAPFSAPLHRKRHSENDPIRPYEPQLQAELEQFNEYSQKANEASQIDLHKTHVRKKKSDRYKEQIQHKKKYHQESNQESQYSISQTTENEGESNSFPSKQKDSLQFQQNEEDEEDQPTSPKIQFDEEGNIETPLSAPRHRHKHKKQEEKDEIQLKYCNEEKEKNDQSIDSYLQQEEAQPFFTEQDNQQIPKPLTKRKRSNQQRKKINNETETKNAFQELDFNQFLNDQAASSSAPSSNSPSQSSQGQQLIVSSSTNHQQKNQDKTSPEFEQEILSTEKVIYNTKRKQLSPTLLLENQQQKQSKFQRLQKLSPSDNNNNSKISTRTAKSSRMKYLPTPNEILNNIESTIPEKISPDNSKTNNFKSRSFISTSQSMIDSKQKSSATKNSPKRKINRNSISFYNENGASSLLSKTGPVSIQPYKPSSSFIESISTESSLKKRKKRQNMTLSNSLKNLSKEDTYIGSDETSDNNNLSKTFVVHSPTKMNQKAKLEMDCSSQMIDFSSTSPVMITAKSSQKKRTPNSPLKNLNDNQNFNRNEIKNEEEVVNSLKKSRKIPKYYKNSPDSQENDENITSDIKFKKSGGQKKSSAKREKKTPKKQMDIKTAHSFAGPGPLSPATPTAQKKGIRMSPSLERMINGIDKLENFDISGIEYDSDN